MKIKSIIFMVHNVYSNHKPGSRLPEQKYEPAVHGRQIILKIYLVTRIRSYIKS